MLAIDELVGLHLNGYFHRHPKLVESSRQCRKSIKIQNPNILKEYDMIWGSSDNSDAFIDRRYEFTVKILDYDLESGLFIARGHDHFGESGLVGRVYTNRTEDNIQFSKLYGARSIRHEGQAFRHIRSKGKLSSREGKFIAGGDYEPFDDSNYYGIWYLES